MPKKIFTNTYLFLLGSHDDLSFGTCFHYGHHHVKKDLKLARMYYLKAAKKGKEKEAFYHLSKLAEEEGLLGESFYYLGRNQECLSQWQEALANYKRAGAKDYAPAMYRAGLLFKKDRLSTPEQTIKQDLTTELMWYREAAGIYSAHALDALVTLSNSEAKAALHLAQMYEKGEFGNKRILSSAVDYYDKACNLGDPVAAYRLGQLYELGEGSFISNQHKAFDYYLISAKKFDKKSLEALERIIPKLNDSTSQLQLAELYENNLQKKELALKIFKKLADEGNKIALERLNSLANSSNTYAYSLANTYESSNLYHKAFTYYLIIAKSRDKKALEKLEFFVKKTNDPKLKFQLADIYENSFREKELALKIFKDLADKGDKLSADRMNSLANRYANCAYELAQSYENEESLNYQLKAYEYYIIAMRNNHSEAENYLTSLAKSGNAEAQYVLGFLYYHTKSNFAEAIRWCLLAAEQQHSKAIHYINNTVFSSSYYLIIAKNYDEGENGISKNLDCALNFYKKSYAKKDKEAAFCLGKIYQFDFDDNETAVGYFIEAVKWGCSEAIFYLEQLGKELNPNSQLKLANLYRDSLNNSKFKACYWIQQAITAFDIKSSPMLDEAIVKLVEDKSKTVSLESLKLFR